MTIAHVTAAKTMLADAMTTAVSAGGMGLETALTVFDCIAPVLEQPNLLPCIVLYLLESGTYGTYTFEGEIIAVYYAQYDTNKTPEQNEAEAVEFLHDLALALQALPNNAGYLINPTYAITEPVERIGESAEVATTGDIIAGKINISFGVSE